MNGGLDIAAAQLFDATVAWHVEYDTAPSKILAHHWPDVPNYGDVTTCDWESMPPVDILTGGYPCQPFSAAGQRKGTNDDRHLWPYVREAIRHLRPRYTLLENVAGHRSLGFDRVLGDLAEDGLDVRWTSLRASDIGAPHHRERLFILVTDPADTQEQPGSVVDRDDVRVRGGAGRFAPRAGRGGAADTEGVRRDYGQAEDEWATDREVNASGDDHDIAAERSSAMPADTDGIRWRQGPQQPSSGAQEVPATVGNLGALPGDGRTDDVLVLPTPVAQPSGNTPENHLRKKSGRKVTDLAILVENGLLATGGLLPTPRTTDSNGPGHHGQGGPDLRTAISHLPTPNAADGNGGGRYNAAGHQSSLPGTAREVENWGKYAPAIHRWEQVTRPAPAPTELNRNNKPRLASAFSEWMMGLPPGHVTDPAIGISRAEQLKAVGNGVCPQQCYAAVRILLEMENRNEDV